MAYLTLSSSYYRPITQRNNGRQGKWLSTREIELNCEDRLGTRRHMCCTMASHLRRRVKVSKIQAQLRHKSLATTGRYLAALRADENRHADVLAALLGLNWE
jgi:integrase